MRARHPKQEEEESQPEPTSDVQIQRDHISRAKPIGAKQRSPWRKTRRRRGSSAAKRCPSGQWLADSFPWDALLLSKSTKKKKREEGKGGGELDMRSSGGRNGKVGPNQTKRRRRSRWSSLANAFAPQEEEIKQRRIRPRRRRQGTGWRARRWKYINTSRVILSLWVVFLVFSLAVRLVRSGQRGKNKTLLGIAASCRLPPPCWRLRLTLQEILRSKRSEEKKIHKFCGASQKEKKKHERERSCDWKMCYFWCSQAHQINLQSLKSVCFVGRTKGISLRLLERISETKYDDRSKLDLCGSNLLILYQTLKLIQQTTRGERTIPRNCRWPTACLYEFQVGVAKCIVSWKGLLPTPHLVCKILVRVMQ